jgi:hypothetical protein
VSQLVIRLRDSYRVARDFFAREIWMRRLDELPRARAHSYRAARLLTSALQELVLADSLHVRAAALTYFTVLYVLQRPALRIRVKDVLDALRPTPTGEQQRGLSLREQLALRLWRELDAVTRDCAQNRSLREVLADEALRDQTLRELEHDGRAHASHEHPVPS